MWEEGILTTGLNHYFLTHGHWHHILCPILSYPTSPLQVVHWYSRGLLVFQDHTARHLEEETGWCYWWTTPDPAVTSKERSSVKSSARPKPVLPTGAFVRHGLGKPQQWQKGHPWLGGTWVLDLLMVGRFSKNLSLCNMDVRQDTRFPRLLWK